MLPDIGRESESWINHFIIAPLFDANVFLRDDIGAEVEDIMESLSAMEHSVWIDSSWCGTRPNTNNFDDPDILKDDDDNFHFHSFSNSVTDDAPCALLRRIISGQELSDTECAAATLSEGGEFVVSNVAVVRMLQKQRSFLWEIYNEFHSEKNIDLEALAVDIERLWFPLFRGYVSVQSHESTDGVRQWIQDEHPSVELFRNICTLIYIDVFFVEFLERQHFNIQQPVSKQLSFLTSE